MMQREPGEFEILDGDAPRSPAAELAPWQRHELHGLYLELAGATGTLPEVLELVLRRSSQIMGWSAAHARMESGGEPVVLWHAPDAAVESDLSRLEAALRRAPAAGWIQDDAHRPAVRMCPLISLPETRGREAACDAGLSGYVQLPVLAEGKTVAMLEFFARAAPSVAGGFERPSEMGEALELLSVLLGLIASRERMREAVRRAAKHARHQMAAVDPSGTGPAPDNESERLYDEGTGLPGRTILFDRIRQAIRRRQRSPHDQFVVMVAEVDGLERVAARGGDEAVAEVLVAAGRRLAGHTRPADTTAIDEPGRFVLIVEGIRTLEESLGVADRARKELCRPFPAKKSDIRLDTRIGVVLGGSGYDEPEALLADAMVASRRARDSRERIQVFDRTSEDNHARRERMRSDLAAALERREFYLEYQPIVSLQSGRITGLEAFMRWRHPEVGVIPPDQFIPVAADSPLIHDMGFWLLDQVCEQINRWRTNLAPLIPPPVGLNVTGRQLFHAGFLERVREILEREGIQGQNVRFDIKEEDLMHDAANAATVLDRLHGMGILVAIDDFGTGFSSLSLLHELPVGALKIDRSFVSHRREELRKWGVARTIVELAKILEVEVIAEGIETREQFLTLKSAGCTQAQGFHFSGPVGAAEAAELIRDGYPLDLEAPNR